MFNPVEIKPLPNYRLWIRYADGVQGEVDLSHLVGKGAFARWKEEGFFQRVRIAEGGAIAWGDDMDLCPDALYLRLTGKTPEQVFPALSVHA